MTKLTLQKNILIHRDNSIMSTSCNYKNLDSALNGESTISVKCISEYMNRRVKKLTALGFTISEIIKPIAEDGSFSEYVMVR